VLGPRFLYRHSRSNSVSFDLKYRSAPQLRGVAEGMNILDFESGSRAVLTGACVCCSKRETERINTSEIPGDSIWNGRGCLADIPNRTTPISDLNEQQ
jgi:hypothetical protein